MQQVLPRMLDHQLQLLHHYGTTSQDVTVSLSSSSTATEGTDYGTVSDITITSGSTSGTATFTPTDDSLYDATSNEQLSLLSGSFRWWSDRKW